jgi:hypothetical protein
MLDGCLCSPSELSKMNVLPMIVNHISPHTGGLSFRRRKTGPEQQLIDWFLNEGRFPVRRGERLTVFLEPKLPSGFPDIVAVTWRESVTAKWKSTRGQLESRDLRLMHFLVTVGRPCEGSYIRAIFKRNVRGSLEKLLDAGMVRYASSCWYPESLARSFAVQRIIAVEAKVNAWRSALDQAYRNTWFAPESYVLVPMVGSNSTLLAEASNRGIGVLGRDSLRWHMNPRLMVFPRSYVSWLFNEWAWRSSFDQ